MKIGIDARNVTDRNSGLVNYVKNLTQNLLKKDHTNDYFLFINKKYSKHIYNLFKEYKNVQLIEVEYDNNFLSLKNLIFEQINFGNLINDCDLDIFHNPSGFGIPRNLSCKRIVLTIHDLIPLSDYDELDFLQKSIYKISLNISLKKCTKIVCISQFTKNELLKYTSSDLDKKISVIYDGYDDLNLHQDNRDVFSNLKKKHNIDSDYVLYLGSGTKRKNLVNLIKAFVLLKKQNSILEKLVISSKFDRKATQKTYIQIHEILQEEHLLDDVIFTGYLSDIEKGTLLQKCKIFIYPSVYEGFGLPILEAMAFQKPIACSDIPPFREICADIAQYFDPYDYKNMASNISNVLKDEILIKKLSNHSEDRRKLFSWDIMVEEYIKLYKDMSYGLN